MPTNTRPGSDRTLYQTAKVLPAGSSNGTFVIDIPFDVQYIAVYNPTAAAITYAEGQLSQIPGAAVTVQPELALSGEVDTTRHLTIWWSSPTPIPTPTAESPNRVNFIVSNEPIQLQVAAINTGQANNVSVVNEPSVVTMGSPNNGTNVYVLKTDANGNLQMIPIIGGAAVALGNPLPSAPVVAGAEVALGNPLPTAPVVGGAAVAAGNPLPVAQSGTAVGGTFIQPTPYSGTTNVALTAAAVIKGNAGVIGTLVNTGTATSAVITIYDNAAAASGTELWSGTLTAGQVLPLGLPAANGIYFSPAAAVTVTATYA